MKCYFKNKLLQSYDVQLLFQLPLDQSLDSFETHQMSLGKWCKETLEKQKNKQM